MRQGLITALLIIGLATPALAQSRRARADAMLNGLWNHIQARQNVYFNKHGRYFQGLLTPRNVRNTDGPTDLGRRPHDQAESWADAGFVLPVSVPASLEIHVYDGPLGHGYTAILHYKSGGKRFTKASSVGPEASHRNHGWREVADR